MHAQTDRFNLPADLHYLNCAYQCPLPNAVAEAGVAGVRAKQNPSGIGPDDFFAPAEAVRDRFARLIGGDAPERVALIPAASYGLATVAKNTTLTRGQRIVVLGEQFPSNVYVWQRLAAEQGGEVHFVEAPEGGDRGRRWNERLFDAITPETAVVAVPPLHWADGTLFDLVAVGERARAVGAALVIDGTQAVGALPFDVKAVQPDALVCAAYKWLLGPYGSGLAWYGPRYDGGVPLEENWIGRKDSHDFAGLVDYQAEYAPGAIRYDVGERSNFVFLPMLYAALDLLLDWTPASITDYCRRLTADLFDHAHALGLTAEAEPYRAAHLFGLRLPPHLDVQALKAELERRNIFVSVRGDALRISPHVYNTPADIDALREALAAAC